VKEQPAVTAPIVGPRTLDQLTTLLEVVDATLGDDERDELDRLVPPGSAVADFFNTVDWMKMRLR
jgi:aryl-alcohol dehydrogenase-like predicted oxidoreductase